MREPEGRRNALFDDSSDTEGLLSVKQAAAWLGMSASWLAQSDVPFVRLGRRRLYRASDLRSHISARVSTSISEGPR